MRRVLVSGLGVLIGGALVGAIAFPEQVAHAAQAIMQVRVVNTTAEAVPVRQQGTANVNVTNSSLSITPAAPITSGGDVRVITVSGGVAPLDPATASLLNLTFVSGAREVAFSYQGARVGYFTTASTDSTLIIPLARPVRFDQAICLGSDSGACFISWVGAAP